MGGVQIDYYFHYNVMYIGPLVCIDCLYRLFVFRLMLLLWTISSRWVQVGWSTVQSIQDLSTCLATYNNHPVNFHCLYIVDIVTRRAGEFQPACSTISLTRTPSLT